MFDQISRFFFVSLTGLVLFLNVFDESKRRVQVWTRGMDFSGLFHISAPIGPIQYKQLLNMHFFIYEPAFLLGTNKTHHTQEE